MNKTKPKKYLYYIVQRRLYRENEFISIYDFAEAVKNNWIDIDGNRVWVVPPNEELTITSVWGFNDLDAAIIFFEALKNNKVGMTVSEI